MSDVGFVKAVLEEWGVTVVPKITPPGGVTPTVVEASSDDARKILYAIKRVNDVRPGFAMVHRTTAGETVVQFISPPDVWILVVFKGESGVDRSAMQS